MAKLKIIGNVRELRIEPVKNQKLA